MVSFTNKPNSNSYTAKQQHNNLTQYTSGKFEERKITKAGYEKQNVQWIEWEQALSEIKERRKTI